MSKLRIIIVTYNWPPRNSISTHRPYSWASYWSKKGAKVTVLTAEKQTFDEPLDMALPELEGVNVIQVPYSDIFSLLPNKLVKFPFILNIAKKIKLWQIRNFGSSWDPRKAWSVAAAPIAAQLATQNDIVVSTFGPSSAHIIACEMKKINPSLCWVADYRDLWSDSPNLVGSRSELRNKIRRDEISTVGGYADCITVVSDDMVEKLKKLTNKNVVKFTNGFDIDEDLVNERFKKNIKKPKGIFRIVYTGTIYQNVRDPKPLLEAIVKLSKNGKISSNSITVDFYGSRLDYIKELSEISKYSPFIRIMGHVNRKKALEAQQNADLLLLLESSNEESRGVLTGKIFEYIASGCPIICIGSRLDFEIGQTLLKTGAGTVFEKHEQDRIEKSLIETIRGNGLFDKYNPKFDEVIKYSREKIANQYFDMLNDLLNEKISPFLIAQKNISSYLRKNTPSITHIITGLDRGGAERSLYNLLINGLEGPFRNRVISLMTDGYYGPLLRKKGIPLTSLNMSRGLISPKALWNLRLELKKNPPDIIQGWMHPGNLAAFYGSFFSLKKTKLAWNVRLSLEILKEMKIKSKMTIKLGAWLSRSPKTIIYNSGRSRLQHRDFGFNKKNDYFIPNGFLTEKWAPNEKKRNQIRDQLLITEETRVIGYVGRGDAQKDLPNLFNAFKQTSKKHPNTILLAVGRNLNKYGFLEDRIKFLGERSDISELMLSFDILCLSSRAEGFPNVIGEAMACGVPCVTTDVGDAKEIVGDTGWVAPPRDFERLAKSLDDALSCSDEELKYRGDKARERVIKHFSMQTARDKYVSIYQSMIG
jgi:glycosyltransferase involved in cell wall biosynthesis